MENLKNTISKTDILKNDLKLAKEKINAEIISGGGTIADTLNDVPRCIKEMLEINYKKVAMIEPHIEVKKGTTIIPVSIDFIPTRVFVTIHEDGGLPNGYSIDSNFKISITSANRTVIEGSIKYNESEKNITIRFATNPGEYDEIMYVQSIVLIE